MEPRGKATSTRNVTYSRTTELPGRTFHVTKHHYKPIMYSPGVDVSLDPVGVEHKVISSKNLVREGGYRAGPKSKQSVVIHRSALNPQQDMGPKRIDRGTRVTKSYHMGLGGPTTTEWVGDTGPSTRVERTTTSSHSGQPESFMNMQKTMESELNRRKNDWEGEVEKMQHSFFDLKTTDSKKGFGDSGMRPKTGNEILTIGDSRNLFVEQQDGSKLYRQKFDLHGFDTNDLEVRADDGKLTITASREEEYEGATSTKQFNRSVDIPECVDTDQISSFLDDDGILTIEAPVDMSKMPREEPLIVRHTETRHEPTVVHRTETREVSGAPTSLKSIINPPEYDTVVETKTTRSSNSSGPSSNFTKTRYIGPDVEETPYGRKFKTSLYIGRKYKAEDITVKLYDYKINVDAKCEEVIAGRTSRRAFVRDVDIPGPLERDSFRAMFGDDGRLYLGGSFSGNDDHEGVTDSVERDMPDSGKSVNVMY